MAQLPLTSALPCPRPRASGLEDHPVLGRWSAPEDHTIPPAELIFMAKRAHAHITMVQAPHVSMISDPGVVTSVILQAVHATS